MSDAEKKKPKKQTTVPTKKSRALLRLDGYVVEKGEHYNTYAGVRQDFIGCIDLLAFKPEAGIIGIQVTTSSHHAARIRKSLAEPRLKLWLQSTGRFWVWSWGKKKGETKWSGRIEEVTLDKNDKFVVTLCKNLF